MEAEIESLKAIIGDLIYSCEDDTLENCIGKLLSILQSADQVVHSGNGNFRITRDHGTWTQKNGVWMTAIYHPSALLRDPSKRPEAFDDLMRIRKQIKEILGGEVEGRAGPVQDLGGDAVGEEGLSDTGIAVEKEVVAGLSDVVREAHCGCKSCPCKLKRTFPG